MLAVDPQGGVPELLRRADLDSVDRQVGGDNKTLEVEERSKGISSARFPVGGVGHAGREARRQGCSHEPGRTAAMEHGNH